MKARSGKNVFSAPFGVWWHAAALVALAVVLLSGVIVGVLLSVNANITSLIAGYLFVLWLTYMVGGQERRDRR